MPTDSDLRNSVPFATLGIPPVLLKGVRAAGFGEPTPLQRKAIPIILKGNDLIGVAQSGTGKTASYLLPTLTRLLEGPRRLRALVLVPTRELATQVETTARLFSRFTDLRVAAVFPGVPMAPQERVVREEGVGLLIATPIRLLELHSRQALNFEDVEILVLDEADRMVDTGLATDLRRILKALPETRQTLLYCATLPPELNRLAKEALVEPLRVDLAPPSKPAAGILQAVYPVPRALKADLLNEILTRNEARSVIVYANTRHAADQLARQLQKRGHTVASLHDSDNQMQRERAVNDLKRGRIHILVATDVASRGIGMDGISHVVNFDVPSRPEDYLHRIGHSTHAHAGGDAFTLMSPEEGMHVAAIERYLGRTVPRVLLPDFDYRMKPTEIKQVVGYPNRDLSMPVKPQHKPASKPAPKPAAKPAAKSATRPGKASRPLRPGTRTRLKPAPKRKETAKRR
ncbi:MAG TPA: DEAD/DEAH box helicase [Candidatus Eisenbacteria bacterium]|nr:DEAD/DEAH box helicase [Candidatus Eisenbacteria bacterium]